MLRAVRTTLDGVTRPVLATARDAATLATERVGRLDQYVGTHRDRLDLDEARASARTAAARSRTGGEGTAGILVADAEAAKGRARTGRGVLCGSCRMGV